MQVLLAAAGEPWETDVVQALQRPGSGLTLVRRCMDVPDAVATAAGTSMHRRTCLLYTSPSPRDS